MPSIMMLFDLWSNSWRLAVGEGVLETSFFQPNHRAVEILTLHQAILAKARAGR